MCVCVCVCVRVMCVCVYAGEGGKDVCVVVVFSSIFVFLLPRLMHVHEYLHRLICSCYNTAQDEVNILTSTRHENNITQPNRQMA